MKNGVIYIHGQGGSAEEAQHYVPLFPGQDVVGLDYKAQTPWQAVQEFNSFFDDFSSSHHDIQIIANSIGAYFSLFAFPQRKIRKAWFISPVVNMERLILDMMSWAGVTEQQLQERQTIETTFGQTLSWRYLAQVRQHPVSWCIPTNILYGSRDSMQSFHTISAFAENTGASVTVMEGGQHWFHTEEQMAFLDRWIMEHQN